MTYECFDVSITDNIAHIVLNRPDKRNAMNLAFWDDLPKIVQDIDDNAKARVIVISSTGPIFTAGIDLSMLSNINGPGDKNLPEFGAHFLATVTRLQQSFTALEDCRIPVIAAIQGGCIGGGVDMTTACDIRLGTKDSYITIYETVIGMTADVGTFPRILNIMPEGIVREMAYTGRKMGGEELLSRGFYNHIYDDHAALLDGAMELARTIAANAPLAVFGCKRAITYGRDHNTRDALDYIGVWNMSMLSAPEMMEAMTAKQEKRAGKFSDLPKVKRSA